MLSKPKETQSIVSKPVRQRSFSLVEALLAMTILGITLTGLMTTFSAALLAGKLSEEYSLSSSMVETLHSYVRCGLLNPMEINEGSFPEHPEFTWSVTFMPTEQQDFYTVEYRVMWMRGSKPRELKHITYRYFTFQEEEEMTEQGS